MWSLARLKKGGCKVWLYDPTCHSKRNFHSTQALSITILNLGLAEQSVGKKMGDCNRCFFTLCPLLLLLTLPSLSGADLVFDFSSKIRDLNLSPSQDVNIVRDPNFHANKLVEKPLRFPNLLPPLSGVSLDNLTHSAGYYPIAHSHAARFVCLFFF